MDDTASLHTSNRAPGRLGDAVYPDIDETSSQIRLLRIHPGSFSDSLSVDAFVQDLKAKPQYEALSYAWGEAGVEHTILMNGTEFSVTVNLAAALRHLRDDTEERIMWVDAICINQNIFEERNHQVKLMGQIYSSARRVVVWLGAAGEDSDFVLDTISQSELPVQLTSLRLRFGLRALCARAWFSRIWVVQEVSLAGRDPDVVCGFKTIPWPTFVGFILEAWFIIDEEQKRPDSPYGNFGHLWKELIDLTSADGGATAPQIAEWELLCFRHHRRMWDNSVEQSAEKTWKLAKHVIHSSSVALHESISQIADLNLVRTTRPYSCIEAQIYRTRKLMASDYRDKIYALIGISSFRGPPIVPDYTLPVDHVFLQAVKGMMIHNLEYLYSSFPLRPYSIHSGLHSHSRHSDFWPSWVPDLSGDKLYKEQYDVSEICPGYGFIRPLMDEIRDDVPPVRFSANDAIVTTREIGLGKILFVYKLSFTDAYDIPHELRQLDKAFREHGIQPRVALDAIMAHNERYKSLQSENRERIVGRFAKLLTLLRSRPDLEFTCHDDFKDICDMIAYSHCRYGREVFMTDSGQVGIAPCHGIKEGDTLAGLFGINFPMILRSQRCLYCRKRANTMVCVAHVGCHQWGHSLRRGNLRFPFTPFEIS